MDTLFRMTYLLSLNDLILLLFYYYNGLDLSIIQTRRTRDYTKNTRELPTQSRGRNNRRKR